MKTGVHVVERGRLTALAEHGIEVPRPWWGVLDVLRMLEGHRPEPPPGRPLVVTGVDALLRAAGEAGPVLRALRTGLAEGRRYFAWKEIPLVVLLDGEVEDPRDGTGLALRADGRRWPLAPLLGTPQQPARPGTDGWWWAPQLG